MDLKKDEVERALSELNKMNIEIRNETVSAYSVYFWIGIGVELLTFVLKNFFKDSKWSPPKWHNFKKLGELIKFFISIIYKIVKALL